MIQQHCFIIITIINTAMTQLPPPPNVETCKKNKRLLHWWFSLVPWTLDIIQATLQKLLPCKSLCASIYLRPCRLIVWSTNNHSSFLKHRIWEQWHDWHSISTEALCTIVPSRPLICECVCVCMCVCVRGFWYLFMFAYARVSKSVYTHTMWKITLPVTFSLGLSF